MRHVEFSSLVFSSCLAPHLTHRIFSLQGGPRDCPNGTASVSNAGRMRTYLSLTKFGIVLFVLITGAAGYALSASADTAWEPVHFALTLFALYFFSAGSFALNQAQEWRLDRRMPRTQDRPIASGRVSVVQGYVLGGGFVLMGVFAAVLVSGQVAALGVLTVFLYNLLYTLYWKKRWAFGAVPGAIPGAMPFLIGYAANSTDIFTPEALYGFMIMFLWQMPHFWSLAIRFQDDYAKGGVPVLPVLLGSQRTLYHIGLYTFAYVALAMASPWFTTTYYVYLFLVIPFAVKVLYEFWKYYRAGSTRWLPFFLWTNFSVLVFVLAPVLDKWHRTWFVKI